METNTKHNFLKMIVVEYSKSQNAFHRYTMQERIENERTIKERGIKSDYDVVAEFESYDEADKFISDNYDNIKEFGYYKNKNGELFLVQ